MLDTTLAGFVGSQKKMVTELKEKGVRKRGVMKLDIRGWDGRNGEGQARVSFWMKYDLVCDVLFEF